MRNRYLSAGTARDIDKQVAKVLRGLGNPEPPLNVEDVVELLKLDRRFYTSTEDGVFVETCSRIKVGILQVFQRPTLLAEAIRKLQLRALYVPDRKRILIDQKEVPSLKVRWVTSHEITHHLCIEWHEDILFGDNDFTINEACHEQIELEANYGAGRLLTLQDHFVESVAGQVLTMKAVCNLAKLYENTITSTLWRCIEVLDIPAFAVIGQHPNHQPAEACKYFIRSRHFIREFEYFNEDDAINLIRSYCKWSKRGKLGEHEAAINDDRGDTHILTFETFATPYDTMTIAQLKNKIP